MHNITLVSTMHSEIGKCNSEELFKILELIKPEVIFEELFNDQHQIVYKENRFSDEFLEIKCIKNYKRKYRVRNIPVDIDPRLSLPTSRIKHMFDAFKKFEVYKKLDNEQKSLTAEYGIAFLNSSRCLELFEEKRIIEGRLMDFMGNKKVLFDTYKLFHEEQDNRENEMLRNINNYCKEHHFDEAVFLIGAAHRKSIMQKISEYEIKDPFKVNWRFYVDERFDS